MSKGSRQRPVDRDKYAANWDRVFGKPKQDAPPKGVDERKKMGDNKHC